MVSQSDFQVSFDFFDGKPIIVTPQQAQLSSDAGLLPIRQFDEQIGLTVQFAAALHDPREQEAIRHSFTEMVRMRVYGILADYADQNDHDVLRYDPVFKLVVGRSPNDGELASQPTLSRFENAIRVASLGRLQGVLVDQFIASFSTPPRHLTFDIDVFDDPTHGQQQLTFFHGYDDQYQYLPRVITCKENDLVVMVCLLFGTAPPTLGIEDDVTYLVERLRAVWPDVQISLRGDGGFAVPKTYTLCEGLRVDYTLGLGMNAVLKRRSEEILRRRCGSTRKQASPNGCSRPSGIRPNPGRKPAGRSSRLRPMPRGPTAVPWSPIVPEPKCSPRPPTTSIPNAARAKTATRNSRSGCRPIGSAITATWPTCSASIYTPRRPICWSVDGAPWPIRHRLPLPPTCPPKPWPARTAATTSTIVVKTTRWEKGILARGGPA